MAPPLDKSQAPTRGIKATPKLIKSLAACYGLPWRNGLHIAHRILWKASIAGWASQYVGRYTSWDFGARIPW